MSRLRFRYVLSNMLALRLPNIEKSKVMNNFDILMPGIWFCCYYTKLSQYKYKPKVELVERIKIITRMSCTFYISIIHIAGIKVINNSVCCYYIQCCLRTNININLILCVGCSCAIIIPQLSSIDLDHSTFLLLLWYIVYHSCTEKGALLLHE